ncbi:MAG: Peptidase [Caulobacteraceae bacterium]|nr:Peptidase [Caulobacteraceae bacterium]
MRFPSAFACGLALLTAAACPSAAVWSATPAAGGRIDPRIAAEAQRLARAARDDRASVAGTQAQIAHLRAQLLQLAAVEAAGERGTGDKRSHLDRLNAREQALTARLGASQNATARLLGVLALFRRDPPPALLVHPNSAKDAVRAQILARALAPELQGRSRALAFQVDDLKRLRRQVEGASEDLFRSESELAEQRATLETQMAKLAVLQRGLVADAQANEAALRTLAEKSRIPAELIARLPSQADALGPAPTRFVEPVQGRIVSRYGPLAKGGPSEGYRWAASAGAPVLAPAAGLVEYGGPLKDYGVILILRTGGAYHLVLAGLGATSAVVGRTVAAGEPVGRMADDAGSAPELYMEVRRGGETVDPGRWFKIAGR